MSEAWRQRLEQEELDLSFKISRLQSFLKTQEFAGLDYRAQQLLKDQEVAMLSYEDILVRRLQFARS